MKRFMLFSIAVIVALSTVVTAPQRSAAATASLANFFPADTFAFVDVDTSDLPATITTLTDIITTIDQRVPTNWTQVIEQQATQMAGRPISFEKDLIGWIGERAAVGVYVPAETFKVSLLGRSGGMELPKTLIAGLVTVKDEALADAFLKLMRLTPQTEQGATINGETVTLYADAGNNRVARWKGYLAVGDVDWIMATARNKAARLDTDANYQKMVATLKPGTLASVFSRIPFSGSSAYVLVLGLMGPTIGNIFSNIVAGLQGTPTPTPSPTPQPSADEDAFAEAALALGTSIYSVRSDSKHLILESSAWLNPDAVKSLATVLKMPSLEAALLTAPKPIAGTLIDSVPSSASAVLLGTDIRQIYESTLGFTAAFMAAQQLTGSQHKINGDMLTMYKMQLEAGAMVSLGLSPERDLLPWLDGDFAAYMTLNQNGVFSTLSQGQLPADSTVLIAVSDTEKAQVTLATLNEAISKQNGSKASEPDANGLYTVNLPTEQSIRFGLVKDTLLITPTSGVETAISALEAKSPLSGDATWSSLSELLPEQYSQVWYLNAANLRAFLKAIDSSASPTFGEQVQQIDQIVMAFESAMIYYRAGEGGISETAYVLTLK